MTFSGWVLSKWYSNLSACRMRNTQTSIDNFRNYLNGGGNPLIRAYVPGTEGMGHQASLGNILRRLCMPNALPCPGYAYTGRIEVRVDAREKYKYETFAETLVKMRLVLPEMVPVPGVDNTFTLNGARVSFIEYDPAKPPLVTVDLGVSGGSDTGDHFAPALNTNYFLRLQPFNWGAPNQIQFLSTRWPSVDLNAQRVLTSFAQRGYMLPVIPPVWAGYAANQQAQILQWLTAPAQTARFDFCPVYSLRRIRCQIIWPGKVIANLVTSIMSGSSRRAVVVLVDAYDWDRNEMNAGLNSVRKLLNNDSSGFSIGAGGNESPSIRRRNSAYIKLKAPKRYDYWVYDPTAGANNLQSLQSRINGWLMSGSGNVLVVKLVTDQPNPLRLTPDLFAYAFRSAALPPVFEGANSGNLAMTLGFPYFHLNRANTIGTLQYPGQLLDAFGGPEAAREMQGVSDQLMIDIYAWPENKDAPYQVVGDFLRTWRTEGAGGQFHTYFQGMAAFVQNPLEDKLNLALGFLNYMIRGPSLPATRALGAPAAGPLDTIDQAFEAAVQGGKPVSFVPQLASTPKLQSFVNGIETQFGSTLVLTQAAVTQQTGPDGSITTVTVTGSSALFGSGTTVAVTAVFTAPNDVVMLECQFAGTERWSLDAAPWLGIDAPYVSFTAADADLMVEGGVGGTLTGVDMDVYASLPDSTGAMRFVGTFEKPPSIASLFQLAGGVSLVAALPAPLADLTKLSLQAFEFVLDGTAPQYFFFQLGWSGGSDGWQIVPNVVLDAVTIDVTVPVAGDASTLQATATGTFLIGQATIQLGLSVPGNRIGAQLVSGELGLVDLIDKFVPSLTLNPPSQPELTDFVFNGSLDDGSFVVSCDLGFDWGLPPGVSPPLLVLEEIGIVAMRPAAGAPFTGSLSGLVTVLPQSVSPFVLTLTAAYDNSQWTFAGSQGDGSTLKLGALMQEYLGGWVPDLDFDVAGLHFSATPATGAYSFGGQLKQWTVPFISSLSVSATLDLAYDPATPQPASPYSGSAGATIKWQGIELDLTATFGPSGNTYTLNWDAFQASVTKNAQGEWVAEAGFTRGTLGDLVTDFVSFATGGSRFGLSAPWDLLGAVPLDDIKLTFNFSTDSVGIEITSLSIDLVFCTIEGVTLTYDASASPRSVTVALNGDFPWLQGGSLAWDATKPETAPSPPGGGTQFLDLRLLALGQQIGIVGESSFTSVEAALDKLRNLDASGAPIAGPTQLVFFDPSASWLVAADFGLMEINANAKPARPADTPKQYVVQLSFVFNDPAFYALRLALDGPAAKILAGLAFEILYRRIADGLGVYQAELALPTAIRQIDMGAYSITLPVIAVAIYTNGDFTIDFGFPWNQDFSRSFTVDAIIAPGIPVTGSAGFYFGKLSSATSTLVPPATNGRFQPVIIFGFGAQVGIGKSVDYGILSAGFALTVFGIIQGVIAKFCVDSGADPGSTGQVQDSYYFQLQGTFGIIGKLYGSVDFGIIQASVDISIVAMAQITYISFQDIPISLVVLVDATASLSIDLGLFSITIHFSFSLTIRETFTISNGGTPPWKLPAQATAMQLARAHARHLSDPDAPHYVILPPDGQVVFTWANLKTQVDRLPLTAFMAPALTVAADGASTAAQQRVCYVALLAIDAADPTVPRTQKTADTSFDVLARQALRWCIAAVLSPSHAPYDQATIDGTVVSQDDLDAIIAALADPNVSVPILPSDANTFMVNQFAVTATVPVGTAGQQDAAPFPLPPQLAIHVPAYGTAPESRYTIAGFTSTSDSYLTTLASYFDALAVLAAAGGPSPAMAPNDTGPSVGSFLFADYFRLIVRQMLQAARDALRDYKLDLTWNDLSGPPSWSALVTWAGQQGATDFTLADLVTANADHAIAASSAVQIVEVVATTVANDSFAGVAGRYADAFTASALAVATADAANLLAPGAKVSLAGHPDFVVGPDSTLAGMAAYFGFAVVPTLIAALPGVLTQQGLLAALAPVALPPFSYTTVAGDTCRAIASRFGLPIAGLAVAGNGGVLFDATAPLVDLPHLQTLTVGALIDDVMRTNGLSRIGGMAGRFSLHGLRLPTDGVTPAAPMPWGSPLPAQLGLYALTGQQIALPALGSAPFTFSLDTSDAELGWLEAPRNLLTFTQQPGDMTRVQALQAFIAAPDYVVAPAGASVGAERLYRDQDATWPVTEVTVWQTPGAWALPYGQAGGVQQLRLWGVPASLLSLDDASRAHPPRAIPRLGVYDEATGQMAERDIGSYGWASSVQLTVKQQPGAAASPAAGFTYELVGCGEADVVLLEGLLAALPGDGTPPGWPAVSAMGLLFQPDQAAGASADLQSDDIAGVTMAIVQANMSTQTHAPEDARRLLAAAPAVPSTLGTPYDFVRLLWECSITRSGGYYLYYRDQDGNTGLPAHIFNDRGEATLTLVVLLTTPPNPAQDDEANEIPGYVNYLVTGDAFDPSQASVYLRAVPTPLVYTVAAGDRLADVAASCYMTSARVADDNPQAALTTGVTATIARGLYQVGDAAPAGDPKAIADHFDTTVTALQNANRQLPASAWSQALPFDTAIALPTLELVVGTAPGGTTLQALATYYGTSVAEIAVDNARVPGLLAAGQALALAGGPFARAASVPAGCVGIAASRPVPSPVPPPQGPTDEGFARAYIESTFTLLGYSLAANPWFDGSVEGLPLAHGDTPTGPAAADRTRTPVRRLAGDAPDWQFQRSVPVAKNAVSQARPASVADDVPNPYAGVGGIAQIDMAWLDPFGNRVFGALSAPVAGVAPTPRQPIPLRYTDALLGLRQWPGVKAAYAVVTDATLGPTVHLDFALDAGAYTPQPGEAPAAVGDDVPAWQARAQRALAVYAQLAFQLDQALPDGTPAVTMTVPTSLLPAAPLALTATARTDLTTWLFGPSGVVTFLQHRAAGDTGWPAPADLPLALPFAVADLATAQIFELDAAFQLARPAAWVDADFLEQPGVAFAATPLTPRVTVAAGQSGYSLTDFTSDLEACLAQPGVSYKVASGVDRAALAQPGASQPIWLTRLAPAAGIGFTITNPGAPRCFAARPLYNTLQSRPDPIAYYDYTSGKGIDFDTPSGTATYQAVDVELWLQQTLAAIDAMFAPALLVPASLVDALTTVSHQGWIERLQTAKTSLAGTLSRLVIPVFADQEATPDQRKAARGAFEQQCLGTLSGGYQVAAVFQFDAQVAAATGEALPPYLAGSVIPGSDSAASAVVTLGKLALATTTPDVPVPLTFLLSTTGRDDTGAVVDALKLQLTFRGLQIEHQRGALPGIEGYEASSWLSFLAPPAPTDTDWVLDASLGSFEVPLPLRAYPPNPSLVAQTGVGQATTPPIVLEQALQWDYGMSYAEEFHYPHDAIHFTTQFNLPPSVAAARRDGTDPFPALAEFVRTFPAVQADLTGLVSLITQASSQAAIDAAAVPLEAFTQLVKRAADALAAFVTDEGALAVPGPRAVTGQAPYSYIVSEATIDEKNPDGSPVTALLVGIVGQPPAGIGTPSLAIDGYDTAAVAPPTGYDYAFAFTDATTYAYLPASEGQSLPWRTITLPDLQLMAAQNALTQAYVTRNAVLADRAVAGPFVFQTDVTGFPNVLRPLIALDGVEIDLATIGTPAPVARAFVDHLDNMLAVLFANAPAGPQTIQVTFDYVVSVNPLLPNVGQLPKAVCFLPITGFQPGAGGGTVAGAALTQDDLVAKVRDAVYAWFTEYIPLTGGELRLGLTVFASQLQTGQPPMPLLEVESFVLHLADWLDPPPLTKP